nr:sec1 family domain-containing protein mip3 [Quercus suber]
MLLDLGVRAVCSLENMCSLDAVVDWNSKSDAARKIVVITSRLLSDAHRAEKILTASAEDTTQSLAAQIDDLVNKSALVGSHVQKNGKTEPSHGVLSFQDALLLTIGGMGKVTVQEISI